MDDKEKAAAWAVHADKWVPKVVEAEHVKDDSPEEKYEATLPFRRLVCVGPTKEVALATLIRSYCELARDGSFNPHAPKDRGAPTIQHVMSLLLEELHKQVQFRYSDWEHMTTTEKAQVEAEKLGTTAGGAWTKDPAFARRNEVISGLSTALAALARVKEL